MSSDQYNKDSTPGFDGSPNMGGFGANKDSHSPFDNSTGGNQNYGSGMATQSHHNQYSMNQNQSDKEHNFNHNMHSHTNNNYMPGAPTQTIVNPYQSSGSQMMGHGPMQSNQPPIGQSGYQPYGQTYNQHMPSMGQDGGMNSGMQRNYMQNTGMPNLPPVGMNSVSHSFQGEKTYEPSGMLGSHGMMHDAHGDIADNNYPLTPEGKREFAEKAARCKQYKQTDVFPAVLLKSEDDALKVIEHLKNKGVSLTATDTLEQTALFYAARDGKERIVDLLLENGCNPNHRDIYGQTAIYYAARENRLEV